MDALTIDDIVLMTDVVSSQGLSTTQLRMFALNQDLDIAKAFIRMMWSRHQIEIMY